MTVTLLLCKSRLLFDFFSTSLNSSLLIFIWTYVVNYRGALDRLLVCMNIILCILVFERLFEKYFVFQILYTNYLPSCEVSVVL